MDNKEFNHFKVNINYDEDFEDIVSDTAKEQVEFEDISSSTQTDNKKTHNKKKRGFSFWWKTRKKWQKAVIALGLCIAVLLSVFAIMLNTVLNYNYNNITEKPSDLGFEDVIDNKIVNIALFGLDT